MIGRRWFLAEDVKGSASDLAAINRIVERSLINKASARAIDYSRAWFHLSQYFRIDQTTRFRGQRSVYRQKVCARIDFFEWCELNFKIASLLGCDERIVADNQHSHRASARSNHASDATKA